MPGARESLERGLSEYRCDHWLPRGASDKRMGSSAARQAVEVEQAGFA